LEVKQFTEPMQSARLLYTEKSYDQTKKKGAVPTAPGSVREIALGDNPLHAKGAEGQKRQLGIIKSLLQDIIDPK
jgi:hypothetical protein